MVPPPLSGLGTGYAKKFEIFICHRRSSPPIKENFQKIGTKNFKIKEVFRKFKVKKQIKNE